MYFYKTAFLRYRKFPFLNPCFCPPNRKCPKNLLYYLKFTYILCFSKIKLKTFWSRTSLSLVVINGIQMINRHICKICQTVGSQSSLAFFHWASLMWWTGLGWSFVFLSITVLCFTYFCAFCCNLETSWCKVNLWVFQVYTSVKN